MLIAMAAGIVAFSPGVILGHIVMRYTVKHSFGDPYRTTPLKSSFIVALVGSASIGFGIPIAFILASALVLIYSKIRFGNVDGWWTETSSEPTPPPRLRSSNLRKFMQCIIGVFVPIAMGNYFIEVALPLAKDNWPDVEMLDRGHAMAAYTCGQALVLIGLLVTKRLRGDRGSKGGDASGNIALV